MIETRNKNMVKSVAAQEPRLEGRKDLMRRRPLVGTRTRWGIQHVTQHERL